MTARTIIVVTGLSPTRQDDGIAESRLSTLGRIAYAPDVPVKDLFDGAYEVERGKNLVPVNDNSGESCQKRI